MQKAETAKLLAVAAVVDNRRVEAATVEAWHEAIGDLEYEDARRALAQHRRESTDYLMPAHLVAIVRGWADELDGIEAVERDAKALWLAEVGMSLEEFDREVRSVGISEAIAAVESRRKELEQ